jgi:hypothetical protein
MAWLAYAWDLCEIRCLCQIRDGSRGCPWWLYICNQLGFTSIVAFYSKSKCWALRASCILRASFFLGRNQVGKYRGPRGHTLVTMPTTIFPPVEPTQEFAPLSEEPGHICRWQVIPARGLIAIASPSTQTHMHAHVRSTCMLWLVLPPKPVLRSNPSLLPHMVYPLYFFG